MKQNYDTMLKKDLIKELYKRDIQIEKDLHMAKAVENKNKEIKDLKLKHEGLIKIADSKHAKIIETMLSKEDAAIKVITDKLSKKYEAEIRKHEVEIGRLNGVALREKKRYEEFRTSSGLTLYAFRNTLKSIEGSVDNAVALFARNESDLHTIDNQK